MPRWQNLERQTEAPFHRGFGCQGAVGRATVSKGAAPRFAFMSFGEMLPAHDNQVWLNTARRDRWGVPIAHIRCWMGENERKLLEHQSSEMQAMAEAAGFDVEWIGSPLGLQEFGRGAYPDEDALSRFLFRRLFRGSMTMGAAIHESGGVRMGSDPKTSVLNGHNRSWDVENLFVTDASCFPTGGTCGTTLTIMAVTARTCEFIANGNRATYQAVAHAK